VCSNFILWPAADIAPSPGHRWSLTSRSGPSGGSGREALALFVGPMTPIRVEAAGVASVSTCSPLSARRVRGGIVTIHLLPRRKEAQKPRLSVQASPPRFNKTNPKKIWTRGERTTATQVMGKVEWFYFLTFVVALETGGISSRRHALLY
jgi:hypothetical protein